VLTILIHRLFIIGLIGMAFLKINLKLVIRFFIILYLIINYFNCYYEMKKMIVTLIILKF
jgi:hypothetical protein